MMFSTFRVHCTNPGCGCATVTGRICTVKSLLYLPTVITNNPPSTTIVVIWAHCQIGAWVVVGFDLWLHNQVQIDVHYMSDHHRSRLGSCGLRKHRCSRQLGRKGLNVKKNTSYYGRPDTSPLTTVALFPIGHIWMFSRLDDLLCRGRGLSRDGAKERSYLEIKGSFTLFIPTRACSITSIALYSPIPH